MAIFQKSIVEKYLNTLDESLIENAFDTYRSVYVPKIDRIRNLKEEQYQTQFLQDIFGSILGYTIDPEAVKLIRQCSSIQIFKLIDINIHI